MSFRRLHLFAMGAEDPRGDIETAKALGCTDLVPMLNQHRAARDVEWIRTRVRGVDDARSWPGGFLEMYRLGREEGIDVSPLVWLPPDVAEIRQMAQELAEVLSGVDVRCVWLDLEGEWRHAGRGRHAELLEVTMEAFRDFPPIVVTSFGLLPKEVEPAVVWACERIPGGAGCPQAYSVVIKNLGRTPLEAPGALQTRAVQEWSPVCGKRIVLGIDVYGAEQQGWSIREAMETQMQAALEAGVLEVALWSEESIDGNSEAERIRREVILQERFQPSRSWGPSRLADMDLAFSGARYRWAAGGAIAGLTAATGAAFVAAREGRNMSVQNARKAIQGAQRKLKNKLKNKLPWT